MSQIRVRKLDSDGDMAFGHGVFDYWTDAEAVAQLVTQRLRLFLGEWFLDVDQGVNYLGDMPQKPPAVQQLESDVRFCIMGTPFVLAITSFRMVYSGVTRKLQVLGTIQTQFGAPNFQVSV